MQSDGLFYRQTSADQFCQPCIGKLLTVACMYSNVMHSTVSVTILYFAKKCKNK